MDTKKIIDDVIEARVEKAIAGMMTKEKMKIVVSQSLGEIAGFMEQLKISSEHSLEKAVDYGWYDGFIRAVLAKDIERKMEALLRINLDYFMDNRFDQLLTSLTQQIGILVDRLENLESEAKGSVIDENGRHYE